MITARGCLAGLIACAVVAFSMTGCNDSSTPTYNYAGPGSEWTMSRSGNSYTLNMKDGADSLVIQAEATALASGHLQLKVKSATAGGGATAPAVGTIAHAIEVPGTVFMLLPVEANAETITMIASGDCPTTDFTANWVIGNRLASAGTKLTDNTGDWLGSISWNTTSGSATFPIKRSVEDPGTNWGDAGAAQAVGVCANGRVSNSGANIEAYFTRSGLTIVATNVGLGDESHIIGIPQAAVGTASSIYGDYAGFIFDQENNGTFAVTSTIATGGGAQGNIALQVVTGSLLTTTGASYNMQIANIDSPGSGFLTGAFTTCTGGSVTNFDGNCEMTCAVSKNIANSGKNVLYCIGQHPGDEDDRMTVLLVQK